MSLKAQAILIVPWGGKNVNTFQATLKYIFSPHGLFDELILKPLT